MLKSDLPLTPLKLEKYLKKALGYNIDFDLLYTVYTTKNAGSSIDDLLSADELDALYEAVADGYAIKSTATNKSINILYAEGEEIAADGFRCVEVVFIYDSKLIALAFSRFGTSVYLDNKVIKEL